MKITKMVYESRLPFRMFQNCGGAQDTQVSQTVGKAIGLTRSIYP